MQSKNESQRKKERKSGGWGGKGQRAELGVCTVCERNSMGAVRLGSP